MTDSTKKKVHNVAARIEDQLYRSVKRTFADTDETFQSLIVKLFTEYVRDKGGNIEIFEPDVSRTKRRGSGK